MVIQTEAVAIFNLLVVAALAIINAICPAKIQQISHKLQHMHRTSTDVKAREVYGRIGWYTGIAQANLELVWNVLILNTAATVLFGVGGIDFVKDFYLLQIGIISANMVVLGKAGFTNIQVNRMFDRVKNKSG